MCPEMYVSHSASRFIVNDIAVTFSTACSAATISNDGATIVNLLDIVHPATRTLVDIAKSQDAEVRRPTFAFARLGSADHKLSN